MRLTLCCELPCVFAFDTQPANPVVAWFSITLGDVTPASRNPPEIAM